MPQAHRDGDSRVCGATTTVTGQSTVWVNGKLWSVLADPDDHGDGALINSTGSTVIIEGKPVIVNGPDHASPDTLCLIIGPPHCDPMTAQGSDDVYAY